MASLLWIVKTSESKSLSHSDEKEQLRVYSHAQRNSRRPEATKKQRPAKKQRHVVNALALESRDFGLEGGWGFLKLIGPISHIKSRS
jgi:hypothetical protein